MRAYFVLFLQLNQKPSKYFSLIFAPNFRASRGKILIIFKLISISTSNILPSDAAWAGEIK